MGDFTVELVTTAVITKVTSRNTWSFTSRDSHTPVSSVTKYSGQETLYVVTSIILIYNIAGPRRVKDNTMQSFINYHNF